MKYNLVTDSCCELTQDLITSLNAKSVPLTMRLGEKEFVDDENLNIDEFITEMNNYAGTAKSSCPSPHDYAESFKNEGTTFGITISSNLSGSYSSAMLGKQEAEKEGYDVHVFDSKSASVGQLVIGYKIKECIEKGLARNEIIEQVEKFISEMKTFFVLENLDNLIKNGRMNKIVGKIVSIMNIRLILGADSDGHIASYDKARGPKHALATLADTIVTHCKDSCDKILAIAHCNNPLQANQLKDIIKEKLNFKDIIIVSTRGLSSMYANKGGIIVAF